MSRYNFLNAENCCCFDIFSATGRYGNRDVIGYLFFFSSSRLDGIRVLISVNRFKIWRYEKQMEQEEVALQQQRKRLFNEVAEEKERMNQKATR